VLEKLLCLLGLTILFCPLFFQTIDVKQLVNLLNCKHRKGFVSGGVIRRGEQAMKICNFVSRQRRINFRLTLLLTSLPSEF
jgi:hypothetical protein